MAGKQKAWTIAGIAGICGSVMIIFSFYAFAQERFADSVIRTREKYFLKDHKPLYDTVDSIKQCVRKLEGTTAKQDTLTKKIYYLLDAMATSDQKTNALNKFNQDKDWGIR